MVKVSQLLITSQLVLMFCFLIFPQMPRQQFRYLLSAYRVGMLAMDTLARRIHDDRPQAKYARNPPYGEDVKW